MEYQRCLDMEWQNICLTNLLVTENEVLREGKSLVDQVPADCYAENKEHSCGVGWLFLPTWENLKKESAILGF